LPFVIVSVFYVVVHRDFERRRARSATPAAAPKRTS
jgi:hypothetical protein